MALTVARFTTYPAKYSPTVLDAKTIKALRILAKTYLCSTLGGSAYTPNKLVHSSDGTALLEKALGLIGGLDAGRIGQASVGNWMLNFNATAPSVKTLVDDMKPFDQLSNFHMDLCELYIDGEVIQAAGGS